MKTITAYQTTDGKLTTDKNEATKRQKSIDMKKAVEEVVDDNGWNSMTKNDVRDLILENRSEILKALK